MQYSLALLSALLGVAVAAPQGVTDKLTPTGAAPAGCTGSFDGNFEITIAEVTEKRAVSMPQKRAACGKEGVLVLSLKDGDTLDAQGRTGYIASNHQFQFDKPAQAGALITNGFSVCQNNILALGDSQTFYRCLSGDFYNLYDTNWAAQCEPVSIIAVPCGGEDSVTQNPDGQPAGTTVVQTTIVTALPDGQPQVVTTEVPIPICQIGDGQVQAGTTPCVSAPSAPTSTYVPVSEYTDGQIQVTPPGSGPAPSAPTATGTAPAPSGPSATAPGPSETAPSGTAPAPSGTAPSGSAPASSGSAPAPSSSGPVSSSASVPASSSSAVASGSSSASAPAATTSAPGQSGSSRVSVGSVGALILGALIAFFYL